MQISQNELEVKRCKDHESRQIADVAACTKTINELESFLYDPNTQRALELYKFFTSITSQK